MHAEAGARIGRYVSNPRLLLAWGSPYNLDGMMVPLMPRLAEVYDIHVLVVDYHLSTRVTEQLRRWQDAGVITGSNIVPVFEQTWRLHGCMAVLVRRLRRRNFDVFLSLSMMQVWERYLLACALSPEALRICFFSQMTSLFEHESLVRDLLAGKLPQEAVNAQSKPLAPPGHPPPPPSAARALRRLVATPGAGERAKLAARYARALWQRIPLPRLPQRSWHEWLDRYLLPGLLVGRTFPFQQFDRLTQLGTRQFDAMVFLDPLEARAFGALYGNPNMYVVQHPLQGNCRCATEDRERRAVLSPLSGLMGSNTLSAELLEMYRRDLGTALHESGAQELHLRLHPRETGRWPQLVLEHLRRHGIPARIVDFSQPIREVVCDYAGVVGSVSAALRDARGSCDYAFVAGMVAVSQAMFPNPKFIFGASEGVEWIEADGSHPPGLFQRRRYQPPPYPSLIQLLADLRARRNAGEFPPQALC